MGDTVIEGNKNQNNDINSKVSTENQAANWFNEYETQTYSENSGGFLSFLFRSKLFIPIAIAVVVIMLFSIVYALVPKTDDTSSISGEDTTSKQEQENGGANAPGSEGVIADEGDDDAPPRDGQDYYTDDQADEEGYSTSQSTDGTDADSVSDGDDTSASEEGSGSSNPWLDDCPEGSIATANGGCRCPDNQVGTPGHCVSPPPLTTPNPDPSVILKSSQKFNPAVAYVFVRNATVVNIPQGTRTGVTVYKQAQKVPIVELQAYSNGRTFLLTKDQVAHGSKVGFALDVLKVYTPPPTSGGGSQPPKNAITKVLVFIGENKKYSTARNGMKYAVGLAGQTGAIYTKAFSASEWASKPNYVALGGGDNFNSKSNDNKLYAYRTIFGIAIDNGKASKLYTMGSACKADPTHHDPWYIFSKHPTEKAYCRKYNVNMGINKRTLAINNNGPLAADIRNGSLPQVGLIIPNSKWSSHDQKNKAPTYFDQFFKVWMQRIMQSKDWQNGNLAVVVTYDEANLNLGGSKESPGQILTMLYHPALAGKSKQISTRVDHYSLIRLWAEVAGVWNNPSHSIKQLKSPGNSQVANANSMTTQLGLTPWPN